MFKTFGFIFLSTLMLSACGPSSDESEPARSSILSPCPGFAETGEVPAVANAECGYLSVLENPGDSEGRNIELYIQRLPAISSASEQDPLFIIVGGPGQAATEFAPQLAYLFSDVRKKRDIVLLDQRGTGKSNPLDCDVEREQDFTLTDRQVQLQSLTDMRTCIETVDADLRFYTTPYAMDDLDKVRKVLGYQQINLWGVSYGTRAALEYARRFPRNTRTMILDASAPVQMMIPFYMESDADAALASLLDDCDKDESCHKTFGETQAALEAVLKDLKGDGRLLKALHPSTQVETEVRINAKAFARVLRMALYSRELAPLIPLMIQKSSAGDFQLFLSIALLASSSMEEGISELMHLAVLCNEDMPLLKKRQAEGELPAQNKALLAADSLAQMESSCALVPSAPVPDIYYETIVSDVPTLIMSGAADPATPPYWGEQVLEGLSRGKHLVAEGGHHGISSQGCVPDLMSAFIAAGSVQKLDVQCVDNIRRTPLFIDVMGPEMQGDALSD